MKVTYFFLVFIIITLMIILFRSENKFQFLKAGILFAIQILFSMINFLVFFVIAYLLMNNQDHIKLGNLFLLLAIFVILSGILLFWGMLAAAKIFKFSSTTLTLVEYYIQWSLIYVTVYQAIFSNIRRIKTITEFIEVGNFLDPNLIVVLVLPSFISVWIAVILYKKHVKLI
ncbi:SA1002 family membrane protein [Lactobacillus sp. PSON]|uniref:SA1002 family membrane protein n=1 Tax=Lactobacillus sp. PSON TaxID=3455454 RepID=UPI0040426CBB